MKFISRQYSQVYFSVLIALSGTANAATTYKDGANWHVAEELTYWAN
ncbi:hypothetical protein G9J47_004750 [Salmonella enterica]|nr:hypothetical protein [Salmonella enterica]EEL2048570.1 hypothetical protein [Salmonella enterica]EGG4996915.1 hypothetical protein [Salmonella enterica]